MATRLLTEENLELGENNAHLESRAVWKSNFYGALDTCSTAWRRTNPPGASRSLEFEKETTLIGRWPRRSCVTFFKDAHVFVARRSEAFLSELGRHNYVTPTSYLELLATYKQVLALKRDEVGTLKNRLRVGLDKLIATAEQVEDLQVKLTAMEPVLIKTQGEVEEMIINIDKDKRDAAETQTVVAAEEEAAQTKAAETKAIADDAQRDLDEALPALEEAVKCLNSLKKSDIDEVRTMGKPPAPTRRLQ